MAGDGLTMKAEVVVTNCGYVQAADVSGAERGVLRVNTEFPYDRDDAVLIRIGDCSVRGRVAYSVANGNMFRTCIELGRPGGERRRHRRVPLNWRARVTVIAEIGRAAFDAELLDISSSGMGLHCGRHLQSGEIIAVETPSCIIFGEVVQCLRKTEGQYHVGARVTELLGAARAATWPRLLVWIGRLFRKPWRWYTA